MGIGDEMNIFLQALLSGNLVYLVYSLLRVFRRIVKHNLFWVSLEDLLFWLGTALFLFVRICQVADGIIRWYFVFGVLFGTLITHKTMQKIVKKHIAKRKKRE